VTLFLLYLTTQCSLSSGTKTTLLPSTGKPSSKNYWSLRVLFFNLYVL
jgi:hypothetical protein